MTEDEKKKSPDLDWKDYIALAIAALETVLLPLLILILIMVAVFIVIR